MTKKLAIRGHATRGKEVIELLEMFGGNNTTYDLDGSDENAYYYIHHGYIDADHKDMIGEPHPEFKHYTLEKFLEKFPYKVGDKAFAFDNKCTIIDAVWDEGIYEVVYTIKFDTSKYTTTKLSNQLQPNKEETTEEIKIAIPKGYEFAGVDDDKQQVVFKLQPQYPKTYEECCKILDWNHRDYDRVGYKSELLCKLQVLLLCRDAYWKIAGEQMGLGKPWEPNWRNSDEDKHCIEYSYGRIDPIVTTNIYNYILAFPTKEMRDAFYENFKDLIEQCKELL